MNYEMTSPPPYSAKYTLPESSNPPPITNQPPTQQSLMYGQTMIPFSEYPVHCICPKCGAMMVTRTEKQAGLCTWLLCGGLLIMGCWLCCCLIPFCIDATKDTMHYCPNCATPIGVKRVI